MTHPETQPGTEREPPRRRVREDDTFERTDAVLRRPGRQLLQSALLLLLAEKPRHGYALTNAVAELGLGEMDRPRIYRALAELELQGQVRVWDETSPTGHTKRVYSVTDPGHEALHASAIMVAHERAALGNFLQRYERMTPKRAPGEVPSRRTFGTGNLA